MPAKTLILIYKFATSSLRRWTNKFNMATNDAAPAKELPERSKGEADAATEVGEDGEKGPSKSALKKAAKDKEKVRKQINTVKAARY